MVDHQTLRLVIVGWFPGSFMYTSEKSSRKEYEYDSIIDDKFCSCLHIALSGLKGSLEQLCKCTNKV